jgi:protein-tyrosine phosphatase
VSDDFARRHIPFEACWNIRDIGGYGTADGGTTAWQRYFRSGALEEMTPADRERLAGLAVATVIDLRRPDELEGKGGHPAADIGARYLHLPPLPDGASQELDTRFGPGISGARYLGYLDYAAGPFREIFEVLAAPETYPAVVHCTAGKDRTGVVTAMALTLAGVEEETIALDFALTNRDTDRWLAWMRSAGRPLASENPDEARRILGVPPEAIRVFLAGLRERYGSVEGYLRTIGLSASTLRGVAEALRAPAVKMDVR